LNQQHIKKQQLTEAEIIYGPLGPDAQEQMEIGELGLCSKQFLMMKQTEVFWDLTLSAQHPFQNFCTPCILNVNNTGTKQGSIMK
jgi:hypothetical protein